MKKREKEIIYFALSRLLDGKDMEGVVDKELSQEEFNEIDNLRDQFYLGEAMPTY